MQEEQTKPGRILRRVAAEESVEFVVRVLFWIFYHKDVGVLGTRRPPGGIGWVARSSLWNALYHLVASSCVAQSGYITSTFSTSSVVLPHRISRPPLANVDKIQDFAHRDCQGGLDTLWDHAAELFKLDTKPSWNAHVVVLATQNWENMLWLRSNLFSKAREEGVTE